MTWSGLRRTHYWYSNDRTWTVRCCTSTRSSHHCHWTEYINDYDSALNYQLPNSYHLVGIKSEYHKWYIGTGSDRRYYLKAWKVVRGKYKRKRSTLPNVIKIKLLHQYISGGSWESVKSNWVTPALQTYDTYSARQAYNSDSRNQPQKLVDISSNIWENQPTEGMKPKPCGWLN